MTWAEGERHYRLVGSRSLFRPLGSWSRCCPARPLSMSSIFNFSADSNGRSTPPFPAALARLTGSGNGLTQDHLSSEMFGEERSPGMYAHILLSTDGSDVAGKGLEHGLALAKALNAKVTVITVTEPLPIVMEPLPLVTDPLAIDFGGGHVGRWISLSGRS